MIWSFSYSTKDMDVVVHFDAGNSKAKAKKVLKKLFNDNRLPNGKLEREVYESHKYTNRESQDD